MLTKHNFPDNIKDLFVELSFRKKIPIRGDVSPTFSAWAIFLKHFIKTLGVYTNYENTLFVGDFNAQIGETHLDTFYIVMSYQKSIKNQHVIRTQKIQVA